MKKLILLFTFLLGCFTAAFSQSAANGNIDQSFLNDFVCRNWTTADGLPGMTITAIMQDNKGYIYIGTYDGLVRFDGVEFVNFTRTIDPKYDFASVRSIFQDSDGNLWVGHNDEGVSCIQPDGTILKYTTDTGLPHNSIRAICEVYTVSGIIFSVGMSIAISAKTDQVTKESKRNAIRGSYKTVRNSFMLLFGISTLLFIAAQAYAITNYPAALDLLCVVFILVSIVYYIYNFVKLHKLGEDIEDQILKETKRENGNTEP